jgi:predicted transcriptional regulator
MMKSSSVITARLDPDTLASLDQLAERHERSRAWLVNKAVSRFVKEEIEFLTFLQVGEDEIDRGEVYSHDDMEAWFEGRKQQRSAA